MERYVITISRQFGSLGRSIAQKMSELLHIEFYDRDIVEATAKRLGQPISVISNEEENANLIFFRRQYPLGMGLLSMQEEIFSVQQNIIQDLAAKESCIIVGRCANYILKEQPRSFNIYIYAPYERRLHNCTKILGMDLKTAKKYMKEVDRARENYRKRHCGQQTTMMEGYDLMVDSSKFGVEGTAQMLADIVRTKFIEVDE